MKRGIVLILLTALISGFSIFMNSFGVQGFDSSVFTFSKNIVVAVFLLTIMLAIGQGRQLKELSRRQWLQLAGIGLIGGSIPFLMFFKGLQLTSGATSGFIHKTLFIYASLLALIFLKEKLSKGIVVGALLLLAGNYFMLKPDFVFSAGYLLIIGATIFWAAENTLSKHVLKDLSGNVVAFGRMFFGSTFVLAFLFATGKAPLITAMTSVQYTWIFVASAFLLGYLMTFYNGLKHVKVSVATSILALGAPITTLLDWAFKGTAVTAFTAWGMVLIAAGAVSIVWFVNISGFVSTRLASWMSHNERN